MDYGSNKLPDAAVNMSQGRKYYFSALEGWRFWAAVVIVIHHINRFPYFVQNVKGPSTFTLDAAAMAFFFMLSGFLAAASTQKEQWDFCSVANYYTKRLIRIWPQHFLVLLLFILLPFKSSVFSAGTFLANLFLLQSWFPEPVFYFSYNAPSWYLSTLLGLYFMVPIFMRYFKTSIALSILLPMLLSLFVPQNDWFLYNFYYVIPFSNAFKFLSGMAAYQFVSFLLQKQPRQKHSRFGFFLWSVLEIAITALVIFSAASLVYPLTTILPKYLNLIFGIWVIRNFLILLPLLVFLVIFSLERGIVSRLLSARISLMLGKISFVIYLWHFIIRDIILHYNLFRNIPIPWRLPAFVLITVILAFPLEYGLNSPITRFLSSFHKKHPLRLECLRQYAALIIAAGFSILYLVCVIPRPVDYTSYAVGTMRVICDKVIADQVRVFHGKTIFIHPGQKPTSVIFHLNQCVDKFSCTIEPGHKKTDVIVKIYLDNLLLNVIHAAGKGNLYKISIPCSKAKHLRIEVDKNGSIYYDGTSFRSVSFQGY